MEEKSRRPEDTPFKQQKLKAWQPILTPNWVIGTFFIVGLIFIPIGIILRVESDRVVEYSLQYDGSGALTAANGTQGQYTVFNINGSQGCQLAADTDGNQFDLTKHGCILRFNLDQDMKAPIYVYYQLDNFYQNHRRYVASRSDEQLRGTQTTSLSDCDPMSTTKKDTKRYDSINTNTTPDVGQWQLNPCGLIANSMFNDIFWINSITTPGGQWYGQTTSYPTSSSSSVEVVNLMSQTGIAWQSDIDAKFDNIPENQRLANEMYLWQNQNYRFIIPKSVGQKRVLNMTAWTTPASTAFGVKSEHFIVWMRTAGLPNFRKLYGHIDTDLPRGTTLEFLVSSNFVVNSFEGKKSLVLSTTSWFGGRNPFLGIAYITVGSLCMVLSILFFAKHKLSPRKLGDTRYLVWKNNQ
ncbi:ALA-interacting subunit 3 [Thraustotheca clavata]|uniref:ALA-interacting subunit 3 n=1 Tax=Thraustotheca clavata TaxID=74557 RepID=A0A1V9Z4V2_9STRA|nr:ALA-interacting subunit 3 [Thraustotheca clavata]